MRGTVSTAIFRADPSGPIHARATPSPVRLALPAHARNIAVVRRALEAIAEEFALPRRLVEDMRLAVTEACTNVVRHAYGDRDRDGDAEHPSALRVALLPEEHGMRVVVEDRGRGLNPSPDLRGPGLGLPLIAALTSELEISHGADDRGSRVAMAFVPAPIEAT
jgi:anti-sigma regulatory factor (Ser/Thr protein kinase)